MKQKNLKSTASDKTSLHPLFVGIVVASFGVFLLSAVFPSHKHRLHELAKGIPQAQAATTLFQADFSKLWGVRTGAPTTTGILQNNVYYSSGISNGYLNIEVKGGMPSGSSGAGVFVPYTLPTSGQYWTEFTAKLVTGSNYNSWVRLMTNVQSNASESPTNGYLVSINPSTQAYDIQKISGGSFTALGAANGIAAIATNDQSNKIRVTRNHATGTLTLSVNNTLVAQVTDTSFTGGMNRVSLSTYSEDGKLQVSGFKVAK